MNTLFQIAQTNSQEKNSKKKENHLIEFPLNSFTLFFNDDILNVEFNNKNLSLIFSITLLSISFIYSLVTFILIVISSYKETPEIIATFAFAINCVSLILYILLHSKSKIFRCKDKKLIELIILYEQYVMITLINCLLKHHLKKYHQLDYKYVSIGFLIADIIFKQLWVISPLNEFTLVFCCNIICVIILFPFFIFEQFDVILHLITLTISMVILTLISFQITKSSKIIFCLNKLTHSGYALLDVINTGYASVSYKGDITYSNSFFDHESFTSTFNVLQSSKEDFIIELINSDFEKKNEEIWQSFHNLHITSEVINFLSSSKRMNKPLDNSGYLTNLNDNCKSAHTGARMNQSNNNNIINNNSNDSQMIFDYFRRTSKETLIQLIIKSSQMHKNAFNQFTYLGQKKFVNEKERKIVLLNVYFRNNNPNRIIEFIFNDESKGNYQFLFNSFVQQISEYLHDFKNPLITLNEELSEIQDTFINLQNENKNEFKFDDAFIAKIDFLASTTSDCTDMIRSFASYSKNVLINTEEIELKMTTFDLTELLQYICYWMTIKIAKAKRNIIFSIESQLEDSIQFYSDKMKLKQVLINILSNSFKFTTKGYIILKVGREKINNKVYIKFEVEDSGIGMDENIKKSIFKPFVTHNPDNLNKEGCGLGLVISKKISEKLGIALEIESFPQRGTKMWFYCEEKEIFQNQIKSRKNTMIPSNQDKSQSKNYNSCPTNKVNNPIETNVPIQVQRKKSQVSKLNVIKEESSIVDNNNNNDTLFCQDSLQISPLEKTEYFLSSPKKKKNKYSLDIVYNAPLLINEIEDSYNNQLSPKKFPDLFICSCTEFSVANSPFQKNKTLNMLKRGGTFLLDQHTGFLAHSKSKAKSFEKSLITQPNKEHKSILLVDDEEAIRKSLKRLISEYSKTVTIEEASDGLDVLHMFLNRETSSFEWIIIDNEMTYLNGTDLVTILEFFCSHNFFQKCTLDTTILRRLVISTGNENNVRYKLTNQNIRIQSKPIDKAFLKELLCN